MDVKVGITDSMNVKVKCCNFI